MNRLIFWFAAIAAGATYGLSIAPSLGLVQIMSLAVLFALAGKTQGKWCAAALGFVFGLAWFGVAVSWVYVSMHQYGGMPMVLAALGVLAFAAILAIFPALALFVARAFGVGAGFYLLAGPAAWTLAEWLRSWVLTGFPWAAGAYAHLDSGLASLAPVFGALGIELAASSVAGAFVFWLLCVWRKQFRLAWLALTPIVLVTILSWALQARSWSEPLEKVSFRLVQGGVAQDEKFSPMGTQLSFERYLQLMASAGLKRGAVMVLPETIFPRALNHLEPRVLERLLKIAKDNDSPLLFGGFVQTAGGEFANSAVTFYPDGHSLTYVKKHLVPFGEYVPAGFRWLTDALQIPMSDLLKGPADQKPFVIKQTTMAPMLCYEDLFAEDLRDWWRGKDSPQILVNLSNLGWFGDTLALPQHLGVSRMRAMEFARPVVRASNTGATAAIDARGKVLARLPFMRPGVLDASVAPCTGSPTPFASLGHWPTLLMVALLLLAASYLRRKNIVRPAE